MPILYDLMLPTGKGEDPIISKTKSIKLHVFCFRDYKTFMNLNKYVKLDIGITVLISAILAGCSFFLSSSYSDFQINSKIFLSTLVALLPPLSLYFRHKGSSESSRKLLFEVQSVRDMVNKSNQSVNETVKLELLDEANEKYHKIAKEFGDNLQKELELFKIRNSEKNLNLLTHIELITNLLSAVESTATQLFRSLEASLRIPFNLKSTNADLSKVISERYCPEFLSATYKSLKIVFSIEHWARDEYHIAINYGSATKSPAIKFQFNVKEKWLKAATLNCPEVIETTANRYCSYLICEDLFKNPTVCINDVLEVTIKDFILVAEYEKI